MAMKEGCRIATFALIEDYWGMDWVGFVDQLSVTDLAPGETKRAGPKAAEPVLYPTLDYDSHLLKSVSLSERDGSVRVEFETAAEVKDWAQTNFNFFFVPYPPVRGAARPRDPSKSISLPYAWSFYCGVYSPSRIFCKASGGSDFTYDEGYAERSELEGPAGVRLAVPPPKYSAATRRRRRAG